MVNRHDLLTSLSCYRITAILRAIFTALPNYGKTDRSGYKMYMNTAIPKHGVP
jgi:hypothetical protein